jgi:hypothetical protein
MSAIIQTAPKPSNRNETRTQDREATVGSQTQRKYSFFLTVQKARLLPKIPHSPTAQLAEYLGLLAKLASDIPSDPNAKLFRASLHKDPPIHPRRTLDQYYFSTLKNTTSRDRDQVVYRGTKKEKSNFMDEPRIVMVDQLWLWILDDSTTLRIPPSGGKRNADRL